MSELTHRRGSKKLSDDIMLFAKEGNEHYGDHVWILKSKLPQISKQVIEFAMDFYNVDEDEAKELVDPDDIVSDAGAWDDRQFVSELWQEMESGSIKQSAGYSTYDGAIVLDKYGVKLEYYYDDPDEEGE